MSADAHLRPWCLGPADAVAVLEAFASADMARQVSEAVASEQDALAWIERRTRTNPSDMHSFAIDVDGVAVGEVVLMNVNPRQRTAWLAYWVTPRARGRGLASRAAATLVEWGIEHLDLERVELGYRVENEASGAVARAAGFATEGRQRGKLRYAGERWDTYSCARLHTDPRPDLQLLDVRVDGSRLPLVAT